MVEFVATGHRQIVTVIGRLLITKCIPVEIHTFIYVITYLWDMKPTLVSEKAYCIEKFIKFTVDVMDITI